jgi:hypothetical protein
VSLSSSENSLRAAFLLAAAISFSAVGQQSLRGIIAEDEKYNRLPLDPGYGHVYGLPVRSSMQAFVPRIINQSTTNTAASWAVAWYGYATLEAKSLNISGDAITRELPLSPAYNYRKVQKGTGCVEPVSLLSTLDQLMLDGSPRFSEFREFCATSLESADSSQRHRLAGYTRLFNTYDPAEIKIYEIKRALSQGSPVVIGFICPPSFQLATDFWQPREPAPVSEHGLHAIVIVGYDDIQLGGSFLAVNSWGKAWGKNGMTQLRYEDITKYIQYGYRLLKGSPAVKASIEIISSDGLSLAATGADGLYALEAVRRTGDHFRIKINGPQGIFFKAFAIDAAGNIGQIFPMVDGGSTWMQQGVSLPSDIGYYPLTEPAGKNLLVFGFATSEFALQDFHPSTTLRPSSTTRWETKRIAFESQDDLIIVAVAINQK